MTWCLENGLVAYADSGDDLMLAPAGKIVAGEEDMGSVESVFAQARQVSAEAEVLLVDAEWVAPEPEPLGATVTVEVAADDGVDEDGTPQRSLFSRVEFMAGEPEEPLPKQWDEAPTLSLSEWALGAGAGGRTCGRPLT